MEWLGALARTLVSVVVAVSSIIGTAIHSAPVDPPDHTSAAAVQSSITASRSSTLVDARLLVRYRTQVTTAQAEVVERTHGARKKAEIRQLGIRVLEVPRGSEAGALRSLAADPLVEFVERDQTVAMTNTAPNDYWWPSQWSQVKTRANAAWDLTTGSPSVVIAVLDTGVDLSQPDLQGKFVGAYNVLTGSSDPTDDNGHGTWAAGVAAAASDNTIGVASYCWHCSLMPVKVLGADGIGTMSDVAAGITWATDHGARVISMSLSGTAGTTTLQSAVRYAHDRGVVLVAAAGNYGNSTPTYPAAYPEVVSVAGTDPNDALYSWSDFGSWVKLAAPGCNYTTGRAGWFGSFCGTSSATPAVAGIAALAFSYAASATNLTVEDAMTSSAARIGAPLAYGRVDAYATLLSVAGMPSSTPLPTPAPSVTPLPTVTPAPTPTTAPSPTQTVPPVATPAPASTITTTFSGAVTNRNSSRSFTFTAGQGSGSARLSFSKAAPLTVTVFGPDGTMLLSRTGGSPLELSFRVTAGTSQVVVSGGGQSSFSLTLTYPAP